MLGYKESGVSFGLTDRLNCTERHLALQEIAQGCGFIAGSAAQRGQDAAFSLHFMA